MTRTILPLIGAGALALSACAGTTSKLFRTDEELRQRSTAAPETTVQATTTREAELRTSPSTSAPVVGKVSAGTDVLVSDSPYRGFRRARTSDGKAGFVAEDALDVARTEQAQVETK
jgi:hypothetical protein